MHRSKRYRYSITSSAMASNAGGTPSPNAFVVLRLIASSYLVGACAGRLGRVLALQNALHVVGPTIMGHPSVHF
jgi:hypothetical protein